MCPVTITQLFVVFVALSVVVRQNQLPQDYGVSNVGYETSFYTNCHTLSPLGTPLLGMASNEAVVGKTTKTEEFQPRFSTNKSLYFGNDRRQAYSYMEGQQDATYGFSTGSSLISMTLSYRNTTPRARCAGTTEDRHYRQGLQISSIYRSRINLQGE